ncbi:MAG TPA: hypothetical protein DD407_11315 [Pseudohongiella sp.]|mgnify:CR=1 FL=1|nr:hypothetical protein [Gammaproteobacteria bacterium]HBN15617.1 hypothetical protein [Pseudohongiella sp.]|tara:strand:- start:513 stop:1508 length:996 start_codon:yes stop_codon:yes gene_type:complete
MKNVNLLLILASLCAMTSAPMLAAQDTHEHEENAEHQNHEAAGEHEEGEHEEGEQHGGHEESESAHVEISANMAEQTGIRSREAGDGTLIRTLVSYGKLTLDPDSIVHIRARFPGQIVNVNAGLGDSVEAGDRLITVESNDSLQTYTVTTPISGTVLERNANLGGVAAEQTLFTIVPLDTLLAELKIFPGQRQQVAPGQMVRIDTGDTQIDASIRDILPQGDDSPYVIARVQIDNSDGLLAPGRLVTGHIVVERMEAPLVIERRALQSLDNSQVVFIHEGNAFEARPVELGLTDGEFVEVLSGLRAGERYVVDNSYLIKADIEKSGAEHAH